MADLAALPLNQPWFILVVAGTAAGGLVRGLSGFGSALIIIPILNIFFGPAVGVPTLMLFDPLLTLPLVPAAFRRCQWREVLPIATAAMLAAPFGAMALVLVDGNVLRRVAALVILAFVAVMARGWRYRGRGGTPLNLAIGASAGAMSGAIGISGPPVILFWLRGAADAATVRANVIAFFALVMLATIAIFWAKHLFTREVVTLALVLAPVYALSLWLGARAFRFVSERVFRTVSLGLIALVALASLFV